MPPAMWTRRGSWINGCVFGHDGSATGVQFAIKRLAPGRYHALLRETLDKDAIHRRVEATFAAEAVPDHTIVVMALEALSVALDARLAAGEPMSSGLTRALNGVRIGSVLGLLQAT